VPNDPRWAPCRTNTDTNLVWTDDYSNLLSTYRELGWLFGNG